ncbi:MAG: universal stress protein [Alphaproteobacteria bacterium]|nr:universal stress protein [Alphaproteobacteria bacterium]HPF47780.1 universal stress protein [Emcibacteraceae bacterium]
MIKTILVPIGHDRGTEARVAMAAKLADKYDAHVRALHVMVPAGDMFKSMPVEAYTAEAFNQYEKDLKAEAEKYRERFEKQLKASGVRFDWCQQQGNLLDFLNMHSRTADLTVLTQKGDAIDDILSVMHDFIIEGGLPVLVVPEAGAPVDLKNILIAWDGGSQCAKATHNALSILKEAEKVTVLTVSEEEKDYLPEADICIKLARHGVNAEALTISESDSISDTILETAQKINADMIIAGAWGHRRLREIIFGGATKDLLSNQQFSVYLSH